MLAAYYDIGGHLGTLSKTIRLEHHVSYNARLEKLAFFQLRKRYRIYKINAKNQQNNSLFRKLYNGQKDMQFYLQNRKSFFTVWAVKPLEKVSPQKLVKADTMTVFTTGKDI